MSENPNQSQTTVIPNSGQESSKKTNFLQRNVAQLFGNKKELWQSDKHNSGFGTESIFANLKDKKSNPEDNLAALSYVENLTGNLGLFEVKIRQWNNWNSLKSAIQGKDMTIGRVYELLEIFIRKLEDESKKQNKGQVGNDFQNITNEARQKIKDCLITNGKLQYGFNECQEIENRTGKELLARSRMQTAQLLGQIPATFIGQNGNLNGLCVSLQTWAESRTVMDKIKMQPIIKEIKELHLILDKDLNEISSIDNILLNTLNIKLRDLIGRCDLEDRKIILDVLQKIFTLQQKINPDLPQNETRIDLNDKEIIANFIIGNTINLKEDKSLKVGFDRVKMIFNPLNVFKDFGKNASELDKKKGILSRRAAVNFLVRVGALNFAMDKVKELVGNFNIPNLETPKNLPISTDNLPPPPEVPNAVLNTPSSVTTQNIVPSGESGNWFEQLAEKIVPQAPKLDITGSTLYQSLAQNKDSLQAIEAYMRVNQLNPNNIEMKQGIFDILQKNGAMGIEEVNLDILKNSEGLKKAMAEIGILAQNNGKTGLANGINQFLSGEIPKAVQNIPEELKGLTQVGQEIANKNLERIGKIGQMAVAIVAGFWVNNTIGIFGHKDKVISKRNFAGVGGSLIAGGLIAGPVGIAAMGGVAIGSQIVGKIEKSSIKAIGNKLKNVEIENRLSQKEKLMKEIESIVLREIKDKLNLIVNAEGKIVDQKILTEITQEISVMTGSDGELKYGEQQESDIIKNIQSLRNYDNEKEGIQKFAPYYKDLSAIIKEVLVSNGHIQPARPVEISGDEISEEKQVTNLQNQIKSLLTTPNPELSNQTLQQKIIKIFDENGENSVETNKKISKLVITINVNSSYIIDDITLRDNLKILMGLDLDNLTSNIDNLNDADYFLKLLTNAFVKIDAENGAQNGTGIDVDPDEEELEPELELVEEIDVDSKTETEKTVEELKNELLELGKTPIKNNSVEIPYSFFLNNLHESTPAKIMKELGFDNQKFAEFKIKINKIGHFADLFKFIFLSMDENGNSRTLTRLSTSQEKRTPQELANQIEITNKAIKLIQDKVAELQRQKESQADQPAKTQIIDVEASTVSTEPDSSNSQENQKLQDEIKKLLGIQIGQETLKEKLVEVQKDANKMTKLLGEFRKLEKFKNKNINHLSSNISFLLENLFVGISVPDTLKEIKETTKFFVTYFQKEEI